ncbi:MAG: membrane protein insertion efficiency factor YidD [Flavobacteriales bacterium]
MKYLLFIIKGKFLAYFIIFLIKKIWKGRAGKHYNSKYNIRCRFYPSCSEYTITSLEKYGLYKGLKLSFNRIKRCNLNNTDSCIDFP